ncbi:SLBB domain-containing protein [Candidatus Marinimicrobia bacterium]|nr:SLBB domain-containing protein [Candidatus Neomarinimicrobiota bacterium]
MKANFGVLLILCSLTYAQSEYQLQKARQAVKSSGLSDQKIKKIAKAKGYSDEQVESVLNKKSLKKKQNFEGSKAIQNEKKLELKNSINDPLDKNNVNDDGNQNEYSSEDGGLLKKIEIIRPDKFFFGYDIFKKDPSLFQATNIGAVDPNYLIGPGDEIIVMLWGETQFRELLMVDREGFIFIPEVGQVFVNGLNLKLLEAKLYRVLSKSYASLNPQTRKATTFLDVSLGNLRPLRVQVLGEVSQPGAYILSSSSTLFSSLYYFNGPTVRGSLRDIQLIRNNKKIASVDFYDYLLTGKKLSDTKLQLDDIIFIPKRKKTVTISGQINKPGIYELKKDEGFTNLLSIAGGIKITAYYERAQIERIVPFDQRDSLGMDRILIDINLNESEVSNANIPLNDGDRISIFSIQNNHQNAVSISGSVTRPGFYDIKDSLRLTQLIDKADGLLGGAYLEHAQLIRTMSNSKEELIKLKIGAAINGDLEEDILLKNNDRIRVFSLNEIIGDISVSIAGHVKNPGIYPLRENMNLYDLIFESSSGFLDLDFKRETYLKRAELIRFSEKQDRKKIIPFNLGLVLEGKGLAETLLEDGDEVRIYSLSEIRGTGNTVFLSGYVKIPGEYELYSQNMTIYDLIFKGAGLEDENFKKLTFLERADLHRYTENGINKIIIPFNLGSVLSDKKSVHNLKLLPGDEIKLYSKRIFNEIAPVFIQGFVANPGEYEIKNNMELKDLVLEAGGLLKNMLNYKVEVARIQIDPFSKETYSTIINLKMNNDYTLHKKNTLTGEFNKDRFLLKPYDKVFIRANPNYLSQQTVYIGGAVNFPGQYSLLSSEETITEIVQRASGLSKSAHLSKATFKRQGKEVMIDIGEIIRRKKSHLNIKLQNQDSIFVYPKENLIQVIGEVNSPGYFSYNPKSRISDVIKEAGGFTPNAGKKDIFITYPNGMSKKYGKYFKNHKIMDGSTVEVGAKPEEEPLDKTEYFKELTSILANFAQVVSIIIFASRS